MKKSKHMTGKAFSVEVCDAIRHYIGERKSLVSKRKIAFDDRDAALNEKHVIDDHESDEYFETCRKHSDAMAAIDTLSSAIKWHAHQVDELVESADEPQMEFMYEPPSELPRKDPRQMKIADVAGHPLDDAAGAKPAGAKPAGAKPAAAKPAAAKPAAAKPAAAKPAAAKPAAARPVGEARPAV